MAMSGPRRLHREEGRYALVDGIPFHMPVSSSVTPALMAAFSINAERAAELLPGNEVHPFRLWNRGLLVVTVLDYRQTTIGKYIEFSVAIACTHGRRPAPALLPLCFQKSFGLGQFVVDLPVSSEISVKGGHGIWGMPKHRANLRFDINEETVSSQYDLDGQFCMKIEINKPRPWIPVSAGGANYCGFRGLLMKSNVYFKGRAGVSLFKPGSARLFIGDHPRVQYLRRLEISSNPVLSAWFPTTQGLLDDYFESWFLTFPEPPDPSHPSEGMESVVDLGLSQEWLNQPFASVPGERDSSQSAIVSESAAGKPGGAL